MRTFQIALPLALGVAIMAWTYRDFRFGRVSQVVEHEMSVAWMTVSLVFGVTAQLFRGWRWRLSLDPLDEHPRRSHCVYAVLVSYAANLVVPRVGEISRCGILKQHDGVSFTKSLGTVVTERVIDSACILLMAALSVMTQHRMIGEFFSRTGTRSEELGELLTRTDVYLVLLCAVATGVLLAWLARRLEFYTRVKGVLRNLWMGIASVRTLHRPGLYVAYTAGIWVSYFLHFWIAMLAFGFTAHLGLGAALVMFVLGSFAVVVPTPNGAGPWHFVVITLLTLYGVNEGDAGIFALLVHGIQTFLLILLGVYGLGALMLSRKAKALSSNE